MSSSRAASSPVTAAGGSAVGQASVGQATPSGWAGSGTRESSEVAGSVMKHCVLAPTLASGAPPPRSHRLDEADLGPAPQHVLEQLARSVAVQGIGAQLDECRHLEVGQLGGDPAAHL